MKSIHDYEIIAEEPGSENLNNLPCVLELGQDILDVAFGASIDCCGNGGGGRDGEMSCPPATGGNGCNAFYSASKSTADGNGKTK